MTIHWVSCLPNDAGAFGVSLSDRVGPDAGTWTGWRFEAPADTSIVEYTYSRAGTIPDNTAFQLLQGDDDQMPAHVLEEYVPLGQFIYITQTTRTVTIADQSSLLVKFKTCTLTIRCAYTPGGFNLMFAGVVLKDEYAPVVSSMTGSLAIGEPLSGLAAANFTAHDAGTGIYRLRTVVDGAEVENRVVHTNGGRCAPTNGPRDFAYRVPCRLNVTAGTTIDTTQLDEGAHTVLVEIEDATGNRTAVVDRTITVDNFPLPSGGSPQISGTPRAGSTLTASAGFWHGSSGALALKWQRCDPAGDACQDVGTGGSYPLSLADVGHKIRVVVSARNAADETATAASVLTGLVIEHAPEAVGNSGDDGHAPLPPRDAPTSVRAQLRVRFTASGGRTVTTIAGARAVQIRGRLIATDSGKPIANATVEQATRLATATAGEQRAPSVRTNASGEFSFTVPARTSQRIMLRYRQRADGPIVASQTLTLNVRPRMTWSVSSSNRALRFKGAISKPVPRRPHQFVEVQWRRGSTWATLAHPIAVRPNGSWTLVYHVGTGVRTGDRFQFRAAIRSSSAGYPFLPTAAQARWVTVR